MDKATIIIRIRSKGENGGRKSEEGSLPVIFVISTNNTVENVKPMSDICNHYNDLSTIMQIAYFPPCDNREQNNRFKKSNKKKSKKKHGSNDESVHTAPCPALVCSSFATDSPRMGKENDKCITKTLRHLFRKNGCADLTRSQKEPLKQYTIHRRPLTIKHPRLGKRRPSSV